MGVEVIVCRASALANLLGRLVLPHYRLAITTVTGIPMKVKYIFLIYILLYFTFNRRFLKS